MVFDSSNVVWLPYIFFIFSSLSSVINIVKVTRGWSKGVKIFVSLPLGFRLLKIIFKPTDTFEVGVSPLSYRNRPLNGLNINRS